MTTQRQTPPEWAADDDLERAKKLVADLEAKIAEDPNYPLKPDVLDALNTLQELDQYAWATARQIIKEKSACGIGAVERAMQLRQAKRRGFHVVDDSHEPDPLTDAPIMLEVPSGYTMSDRGIWIVNDDGKVRPIAVAPILIKKRMIDDDGARTFVLTWHERDKGWQELTVDRAEAMDAQKLRALAGVGLPVNSRNAPDLTQFLTALEYANADLLREERITRRLGWHEGAHGPIFVLGDGAIAADGAVPSIRFVPRDIGEERLARGFHKGGTLEGWMQTVALMQHYPRALVGLYASFVAVLLRIIGASGFTVDYVAETSVGKTTVLRVGASVWGNPNERDIYSIMSNWNATRVFVERSSALVRGLPLILDERSQADSDIVRDTLYMIAGAQGRGRGTLKSIDPTRILQTVVLSSGETDIGAAGGATMRLVSIEGYPFKDAQQAALVKSINAGVLANYGHAGPAFIRYLLKCREQWGPLAHKYRELVEHYSKIAATDRASRLAEYIAAIDLAARLAHMGLNLPWKYEDAVASIWNEVAEQAADPTGAEQALRHVVSWANSNEKRFCARHDLDRRGNDVHMRDRGGCAGHWPTTPEDGGEYLALYPNVLTDVLKQGGHDYVSTLRSWRQRDWIEVDQDGKTRNTRKVYVDGKQPRMVAIRYAVIRELEA
jgi:putative DNA primase/helicase